MKKKTTLILIGLLLILAPYFLNSYGIYRLFSLLIGLTIILIALIKDKEDKLWRIVILPIVFLILSFGLDFAIVHIFNRIPVYSTKEVSSKNVINYNSLFYRVYSCNKKLTIDNFYKKDYLCSDKELDKLDSSSFLNNVIENYIEYNNKFVKIEGKVSKINGTYNLEMQAFTLADDSINGNVLFSDNVTLEVNFNKILDLTPYKVYDSIIVIGRIDELVKKGSNYIVKMNDSKILESDLCN